MNRQHGRRRKPVIKLNHDQKLVIEGEISFATIPKLRIIGCKFISEHKNPIFDFEPSTTKDISGLALLTAWTRFAKEVDKPIRFINLPTQLLDMAKLNGLKDLLPIE